MQLEFTDALKKEFQRCYNLEWQLYDSLKVLSGSAQNAELKEALENHRQQTHEHMMRLEQIGQQLEIPVIGLPNLVMKGLAEEALQDWGGAEPGPVTDAMIIDCAQKGEHLEIVWYGLLRSWCEKLGYSDAVKILQQTLDEEKQADELLTKLAEGGINQAAAGVKRDSPVAASVL